MRVQLPPRWAITTNHPAASYGQPVLVDEDNNPAGRATGYWTRTAASCWPPTWSLGWRARPTWTQRGARWWRATACWRGK